MGPVVASTPVSDDPEEWYGLEYTLELSSRERQPSDTQSFSEGGEHSKVIVVPLFRLLVSSDSMAIFDRVENLGQPSIEGPSIHPLKTKITINGRTGTVY